MTKMAKTFFFLPALSGLLTVAAVAEGLIGNTLWSLGLCAVAFGVLLIAMRNYARRYPAKSRPTPYPIWRKNQVVKPYFWVLALVAMLALVIHAVVT